MPRAHRELVSRLQKAEALAWLTAASVAIHVLPAGSWIHPTAPLPSEADPALRRLNLSKALAICRTVEQAARLHPYHPACLPQALAGKWMLQRRGVRTVLRVGVRRDGDKLLAHAWIEYDTHPLGEAGRLGGYSQLDSMSQASGRT